MSKNLAMLVLLQTGFVFLPHAFAEDAKPAATAKDSNAAPVKGDAKVSDAECEDCKHHGGKSCKHCKLHRHKTVKSS